MAIFVFSTVVSKYMFCMKIFAADWDSNCGPLMSEATALPTQPKLMDPVVHVIE